MNESIPLRELERMARSLRVEVSRLEGCRQELRTVEVILIRVRSSNSVDGHVKPKAGILAMLKNGPRSQQEIVDTLENSVESRSLDRKKLLRTVLGRMRREGAIQRSEQGELMLA